MSRRKKPRTGSLHPTNLSAGAAITGCPFFTFWREEMDVICAQCGEPWDFYGVTHDFEQEEIEPFLRGDHCPCCVEHHERRSGSFVEEHFSSLLEATDDPESFMKYLPL